MKIKRYKKIRKILHSYQISHNIRAPFKVALDGEFVQAALAGQIMLKEQLPKMLQEERTTVFVTPCIDNWLRLKGPAYSGALHIASKLDHLKCRHDKGFVRPFECIKHLIAHGNPDRLLIGAQDEPIRKLIRHVPGVPLLLIHGSTVLMESPTDVTKDAHAGNVAEQIGRVEKEEMKRVRQAQMELNKEKKEEAAAAAAGSGAAAGGSTKKPSSASQKPKAKKRKGPAQPNPLSVKKKKLPPTPAGQTPGATGKKKEAAPTQTPSSTPHADEPKKKKQKTADGNAATAADSSTSAASAPSAVAAASPTKSNSAASSKADGDASMPQASATGKASKKRARETPIETE